MDNHGLSTNGYLPDNVRNQFKHPKVLVRAKVKSWEEISKQDGIRNIRHRWIPI